MAALIGQEAALMEELSSASGGGGGGRASGLPPTTPASARRRGGGGAAEHAVPFAATDTMLPSSSCAPATAHRSSLSGSLRDIQLLMDEQVRIGIERIPLRRRKRDDLVSFGGAPSFFPLFVDS